MTIKWEISRTLYNRNGRTSIKDFDTVVTQRARKRVEWEIANYRKISISKRATITVRPSLNTK